MPGAGSNACRISIHAPREGGDALAKVQVHHAQRFQSTPPARGATPPYSFSRLITVISIHAPREGGDCDIIPHGRKLSISIHAPREGGDTVDHIARNKPMIFQSTPPARGATPSWRRCAGWHAISIHAPREGGDIDFFSDYSATFDFNPRPPRGGRPLHGQISGRCSKFQSTPPARGATAPWSAWCTWRTISIHAPREGGDLVSLAFRKSI